jgi:hypothetical protein
MKELMPLSQVCNGFDKLNKKQTKLAFDYGLRQIKYMFDVDKILNVQLPEGAEIIGLSSMGRFTAINHDKKIRYGYFPHNKTWSEATDFGNITDFDSIKDLRLIYDTFDLGNYSLNALTCVIKNLKENALRQHNKQCQDLH